MVNTTSTAIVTINAAVTLAPAPNTLQQTGGFISQGGSTLAAGTAQLVSTLVELKTLLASGASATELEEMGTTYFATQGAQSVYIVELGNPGEPAAGVAALETFITSVAGTNEQIYGYLVPREWDNNAAFLALCASYGAVNAMLYFWVTTVLANVLVYSGPAYKCVYAQVESPTIQAGEFSLASAFATALSQSPSSTNRVPPLCYAPSYGTSAYPIRGNQNIFTELASNYVGWIGTGQEGGISTNILFQGLMSDGNSWNFWYSIDWAQINFNQALANEVINGSASRLNPLYYNQDGINRLQNRVMQTAQQGVSYGLGNGQVVATQLPVAQFLANYHAGTYADQIVINAEPFGAYTAENPNDYGIGRYAGLSAIWITQLGFRQIIFNLNATTLVAGS